MSASHLLHYLQLFDPAYLYTITRSSSTLFDVQPSYPQAFLVFSFFLIVPSGTKALISKFHLTTDFTPNCLIFTSLKANTSISRRIIRGISTSHDALYVLLKAV